MTRSIWNEELTRLGATWVALGAVAGSALPALAGGPVFIETVCLFSCIGGFAGIAVMSTIRRVWSILRTTFGPRRASPGQVSPRPTTF